MPLLAPLFPAGRGTVTTIWLLFRAARLALAGERRAMMPVREGHIRFLDALRALACALVVYCHLFGYRAPPGSFPAWLAAEVEAPLGIIWHFGYMGVALFFIVSGFVIAHVAQGETRPAFVLKRLFRIYPPYLVTLAFALAVYWTAGWSMDVDAKMLALEATLVGSSFTINGPTYTLVIELMFYALAAAILPWFRYRPILTVLAIAIVPSVACHVLVAMVEMGPAFIRLVGYFGHVPAFAVGAALYYLWAGRVGVVLGVGLVALSLAAFGWSTSWPGMGYAFLISLGYATLLFCAGMALGGRVRVPRAVSWVGTVSYSIYLVHFPLSVAMLQNPQTYWRDVAICLCVIAFAAWVCWLLVERPSQTVARWLLGLRKREALPDRPA